MQYVPKKDDQAQEHQKKIDQEINADKISKEKKGKKIKIFLLIFIAIII